MGIQGLIPFLKNATRPTNIKEFKGCTVAIDSYCWLHRGAFACAEKLALGEKTDQYVFYCMKFINNLLSFGIKPIMVFDGCRLPSKLEVEKGRRERREANRHKAAQLLREGKRSEARDCLAQCIDISSDMALDLMKACRDKGVDCIVAPYEADAQLAYLAHKNMADVIITEDSDLVLFGCELVMFKMDVAGNGLLYERRDLNKALGLHPEHFTFDRFRYMCILSGCDYLSSLPGIGLGKALKVFKRSHQPDVSLILKKLPSLLNMSSLVVPTQYIEAFARANQCFLYQLVFDPLTRSLVPLHPYPPDLDPAQLSYAGPLMSDEKAYQIALGNVNVNTGEIIFDFDPDNFTCKSQGWGETVSSVQQSSIWSRQYKPRSFQQQQQQPTARDTNAGLDGSANRGRAESTRGKEVVVKVPVFRAKRPREDEDNQPGFEQLNRMYGADTSEAVNTKNQISPSTQLRTKNVSSYVEKLFPMASPEVEKLSHVSRVGNESHADEDLSSIPEREITSSNSFSSPSKLIDGGVSVGKNGSEMDDILSHYVSPTKPLSPSNQPNIFAEEIEPLSPRDGQGKENKSSPPRSLRLQEDSENEDFTSPTRTRRNVFAVSGGKASKFNLNAPKNRLSVDNVSASSSTRTVEVKSRFFTASKPRKETEFFRELKKECRDETVRDECVMKADDSFNAESTKPCEPVDGEDDAIDLAMLLSEVDEQKKHVRQSPINESTISCQKSKVRPSPSFTKLSAFRSDWRSRGSKLEVENQRSSKVTPSSKNASSIHGQFKPVRQTESIKLSIVNLKDKEESFMRCDSVESNSASESESPIPALSRPGSSRRGLVYDKYARHNHLELNRSSTAEDDESASDVSDMPTNISSIISGVDEDLQKGTGTAVGSQDKGSTDSDEDPLPNLSDAEDNENPIGDFVKPFSPAADSADIRDNSASGRTLSKLDRILTRPDVLSRPSLNSQPSSRSSDKKRGTSSKSDASVHQMVGWLAAGKTGSLSSINSPTSMDIGENSESPVLNRCKFPVNAVSQSNSGKLLGGKGKTSTDRSSTCGLNGVRASGLSKNRVKNKNSLPTSKQQSSISSFLQSNFGYSGRKTGEERSSMTRHIT